MYILSYNFGWMAYNCFLALIAVGLGYLVLQVNAKFLKFIIGVFWLLFLPNTIYIFTDLEHLVRQWQVIEPSFRSLLVLEYVIFEIIGIITFLLAFFPFEKLVKSLKFSKKQTIWAFVVFNFVVAFGMVLGRVERVNSWQVFTNPPAVISSTLHVFHSFSLIALTVLFGLLCNFIYFLFRKKAHVFIKEFLD
jgi:uncharacterized membrane protein